MSVEGGQRETKTCVTCGATFGRPRAERRVSEERWANKIFCTRECIRPIAPKICDGCGCTMTRSRQVSYRDWKARRFCSPACRQASPTPRIPRMAGPGMTVEESNRAMVRALLHYGLHNDGLPGLPAPRFHELAAQFGIAA